MTLTISSPTKRKSHNTFIHRLKSHSTDNFQNIQNIQNIEITNNNISLSPSNSGKNTTNPTNTTTHHNNTTMSGRRSSSTIKNALSSFLSPNNTDNNDINNTSTHTHSHSHSHTHTHTPMHKSRRHSTTSMNNNSNTTTPRSNMTQISPFTSSSIIHSSQRNSIDNISPVHSSNNNTNINNTSTNTVKQFLLSRGFINPRKILENDSKDIKISVATTGEYIFLPTISSNDDEYLMRLNGFNDDAVNDYEAEFLLDSMTEPTITPPIEENTTTTTTTTTTENNVENENNTSDQEIDNTMTPYNIAIILSLKKKTDLSILHIELCSRLKLFWNNGVPPSKSFDEEFYKCSSIKWNLDPLNFNLFIPKKVDPNNTIMENQFNIDKQRKFINMLPSNERFYLDKKATKPIFFKEFENESKNLTTLKPGDYIFILPCVFNNHIPESLYYPSAKVSYCLKIGTIQNSKNNKNNNNTEPVEHGNNTEKETLTSPISSISLNKTELEKSQPKKLIKNSIFKKVKKTIHNISQSPEKDDSNSFKSIGNYQLTSNHLFGEYPIKVIRTPPPISVSTANKPIYINRIWTDSLSYEISFAQKYVSLNSQVPIKIKLAPLEKNICIKRIRVSINEKITFVSKNLEYEYDQVDPVAKDPYNPYYLDFQAKRRKERNLPLLEIRTREKGARALREEIIENSSGDNLISYATIPNDSNISKKSKDKEPIGITEPITIETVLNFPKFEDLDKKRAKVIPPYGIDSFQVVPNLEHYNNNSKNENSHRPSVINILTGNHHHSQNSQSDNEDNDKIYDKRFHQTKFKTNSGIDVKYHTKLNESKRGLYLDSMHFSNIHARHKLEIMLRISKPDPQDSTRLRHYEVLIDTPIFLVSEICNSGNMELPTYHMATTDTDSNNSIVIPATFNGINDPFNPILPPTFEEAISVPNSPLVSPIGSPNMNASYDPDNLYIQQLNLSRATSISGPSGISSPIMTSVSNPINIVTTNTNNTTNSTTTTTTTTNQPDNDAMFNNLDNLLSTPSIFKKDYKLNDNNNTNRPTTEGTLTTNTNTHHRTPSDAETISDPPNYDEAVNN